jgi:hypothetical protein
MWPATDRVALPRVLSTASVPARHRVGLLRHPSTAPAKLRLLTTTSQVRRAGPVRGLSTGRRLRVPRSLFLLRQRKIPFGHAFTTPSLRHSAAFFAMRKAVANHRNACKSGSQRCHTSPARKLNRYAGRWLPDSMGPSQLLCRILWLAHLACSNDTSRPSSDGNRANPRRRDDRS